MGIIFQDNQPRPRIEAHFDSVVIEGVRVQRPGHMSVSQWLRYWNNYIPSRKTYEEGYDDGYDVGYDDGVSDTEKRFIGTQD
jgi:hypothetical protein